MSKSKGTEAVNLMQDLHTKMINLPLTFRERVCIECSWSVPTFYRKMRPSTKTVNGEKEQVNPLLSNAEKEKIISVSDEVYKEFWDYCDKYRKKTGKH
ncbi:hypothetical protein SIO70_05850 [Chitinophaga sancti]|uniref:hypothetical protein n=1 Tax=Chitinophaga sancti TaxID=1004 RepID=UPI002A75E1D5|nr:hypothetical protein [Chitinophaga sancti]WPQ64389.1 hypothetical protein SIO70_05850 [Chitinophaga sancti]